MGISSKYTKFLVNIAIPVLEEHIVVNRDWKFTQDSKVVTEAAGNETRMLLTLYSKIH